MQRRVLLLRFFGERSATTEVVGGPYHEGPVAEGDEQGLGVLDPAGDGHGLIGSYVHSGKIEQAVQAVRAHYQRRS